MKKKLVSLLLTACMVLGMLPVAALAANELTLEPASAELAKDASTTVKAAVGESTDSVYWVTSDTEWIKIEPNNANSSYVVTKDTSIYTIGKDAHVIKVTALKDATAEKTSATVTATLGSGPSETFTVTLKSAETPEKATITLDPTAVTVKSGETAAIKATVTGSNETVYWVGDDTKLITFDKAYTSSGSPVTITAGSVTTQTKVTVTAALGSPNSATKATCEVTIDPAAVPAIGIGLDKTAVNVLCGATTDIIATVNPANSTDKVTVNSTNEEVATAAVGADGKTITIKGVKSGTAEIKVHAGKFTSTCAVTVTDKPVAVESVTLDKTSVMIMEGGDTATVTATVTPDNAADTTLTVKSSNETVATAALATDGKTITIKGLVPGTATITVTAGDKSATCAVTVNTFSIAPLTFDPAEGTYTSLDALKEVKVSSLTPGLKIIYTVTDKDGKPVGEATTYDESIGDVNKGVDLSEKSDGEYTVKATAEKKWNGKTYTATATAKYTINTKLVVEEKAEAVEATKEELGATSDAQVTAANNAAAEAKVDLEGAGLDAVTKDEGYKAVETEAKKYEKATADEIKAAVEKLDGEDASFIKDDNKESLKVVVQIVVKAEPKAYNGTTFTLDISPVARVVATVADTSKNETIQTSGDDKNAAVLKEEKVEAKAAEPIEVTISIPSEMIQSSLTAWIRHAHSGHTYWHRATRPTASNAFSFLNKWGFSEFTVESTAPCYAMIEGDEEHTYNNLQTAVDSAKSGSKTIYILKGEEQEATVNDYGTTTLTFKPDGQYLTALDKDKIVIKNRNGESVTPTGSGAEFTYTIDNGSAPSGGGGGGGGSSSSSSVKVSSSTGGKVSLSSTSAAKGDKVTLTVTPDAGYALSSVTVKDSAGNVLTLTRSGENQYTFTMPAGAVTVTPVFVKADTPSVTFSDVPAGAYYYDAVQWAIEKGITNGTGAGAFSPNAACTRAQMVTFLWRAAGCPEPKGGSNPFADVSGSEYYYKAVLWAAEQGITSGTGAGAFSPNDTVTRGQTVTFLYRFAGSPAVSASGSFSDVPGGEYYAPAVQWALSRGVTNGTSDTTFSPSDNCVRAQIVTFLYRASN